jgi:hypothetical protein
MYDILIRLRLFRYASGTSQGSYMHRRLHKQLHDPVP